MNTQKRKQEHKMFGRLTHYQKVRLLQLANVFITLWGLYQIYQIEAWVFLAVQPLLIYIYAGVGGEIGFHRYWSHRQFETNKFWQYVLGFLGTLSTQSSPITYGAAHRQHHKYSDQEGDPHSPYRIGLWRTIIASWENVKIRPKLYIDLARDPVCRFYSENYFKVIFAFCVIVYLTMGPLWVVFGYCLPSLGAAFVGGLTNAFGHINLPGCYRNHDTTDKSVNSWFVTLCTTFSIGWHNNHHAQQQRLNNGGEHWWEFDLNYYICRLIQTKESYAKTK